MRKGQAGIWVVGNSEYRSQIHTLFAMEPHRRDALIGGSIGVIAVGEWAVLVAVAGVPFGSARSWGILAVLAVTSGLLGLLRRLNKRKKALPEL
jgi:hypothetical protein